MPRSLQGAQIALTWGWAGGEITDVIQALCFLTNADHVSVLNEEWTKNSSHLTPTAAS